jgi:hypothetical protein
VHDALSPDTPENQRGGGPAAIDGAGQAVRPSALGSTTQNWIGRSQYAGDPYLSAAVDGFRIYSRALSASEVSQLNSSGS